MEGGVFSPDDGIADPQIAAPVIAKGILNLGGHVVQGCAAQGQELSAGRVSGVVTEKGIIACDQVVMAGGAWASSFCNQLGISMPQATVRIPIVRVGPGGGNIPPALHTADISMTERGDGGHARAISGFASADPTPQSIHYAKNFVPMSVKNRKVLSPGWLQGWRSGHETLAKWRLDRTTPMEKMRVLNPKPRARDVALMLERARALVPGLRDVQVASRWAGYVDSTPDGVPVMSPIDKVPGFFLAAGFSGHGFGIGTGAGEFIADVTTGATPAYNPAQFRLERFGKSAWNKVSDF